LAILSGKIKLVLAPTLSQVIMPISYRQKIGPEERVPDPSDRLIFYACDTVTVAR
jgi:hypothetical protein